MIDAIYRTVQSLLNKDHYGTLTPERFNEFVSLALFSLYADMFNRYRHSVNKYRRGGGAEMVDYQEELDFFTDELIHVTGGGSFADIPADRDKIVSIWFDNTVDPQIEVAKMQNSEIGYISGLSKPSKVYPVFQLVGDQIKVLPATIDEVLIYYLRTPAIPKWTYADVSSVPVFNPSAGDFQDIDAPADWRDDIIVKTTEIAALHLRELQVNAIENKEDTVKYQKDVL